MIKYPRINHISQEYLDNQIQRILDEDIPTDDFTAKATIKPDSKSDAYIETLEDIIFVGNSIIKTFFKNSDSIKIYFEDGEFVKQNQNIADIQGNTIDILKKERSLLNLIQRLSAIATYTSKFVELVKGTDIKILDTRKTTPLLRLFEKYAVTMGGGTNHRLDLSSAILIKDNHIKAAGSISNAIQNSYKFNLNIEIEADTFEQVKEICQNKIDGILLDNMEPELTKEVVKYIRSVFTKEECYILSSGGINMSNITGYLDTGIDGISMGSLTHSVKSADIHLEFR